MRLASERCFSRSAMAAARLSIRPTKPPLLLGSTTDRVSTAYTGSSHGPADCSQRCCTASGSASGFTASASSLGRSPPSSGACFLRRSLLSNSPTGNLVKLAKASSLAIPTLNPPSSKSAALGRCRDYSVRPLLVPDAVISDYGLERAIRQGLQRFLSGTIVVLLGTLAAQCGHLLLGQDRRESTALEVEKECTAVTQSVCWLAVLGKCIYNTTADECKMS